MSTTNVEDVKKQLEIISKQLPEGWRLGVLRCGKVTLSYKGIWAERLLVTDNLENKINEVISNPPPRLYVSLFVDGKLDLSKVCIKEQGLERLVKEGLINAYKAFELMPTYNFRDWLTRNKLWEKRKELKNIKYEFRAPFNVYRVQDTMREYFRNPGEAPDFDNEFALINNRWYVKTMPFHDWSLIPKKAYFKSVFDACRAFLANRATIEEVAQYSFGALLEVAGHLHTQIYDNIFIDQDHTFKDGTCFTESDLHTLLFRNRVDLYNMMLEVFHRCLSNDEIVGFKLTDDGEWDPVYLYKRLDAYHIKQFEILLKKVVFYEISGYEGRLRFTNAHPFLISYEHNRWYKKNGEERDIELYQHIKLFVGKNKFDKSVHTLEEIRDHVQYEKIALTEMGIRKETFVDKHGNILQRKNLEISSFKFGNITFGIHLKTGKVFLMEIPCSFDELLMEMYVIPWGFDKWEESRKREYLGNDYEKIHQHWENCAVAAKKRQWELLGLEDKILEDEEMAEKYGIKKDPFAFYKARRKATQEFLVINKKYRNRQKRIFANLCNRLNRTAKEMEMGTYTMRFNTSWQYYEEKKERERIERELTEKAA